MSEKLDRAEEPAWKRHGRTGPFDWYVQCTEHKAPPAKFSEVYCPSCDVAERHNIEVHETIQREKAGRE